MENNVIGSTLLEQALTFRPGGEPISFRLAVVNESDQFASFQVELIAPGTGDVNTISWYRLTPEVGTKKPPGARTDFQVFITNSPLVGFAGTINVAVRISSPELRRERKHIVRLTIEQGSGSSQLEIDLPVRKFQVLPSNVTEIPVRVRNLGQQSTNVVIRLTGLDPSWLTNNNERRVGVNPGGQAEAIFTCQPPVAGQAPSREYVFEVVASAPNASPARAQGSLEVLPIGFVQYGCPARKLSQPPKPNWLPDPSPEPARFDLDFKNVSNIGQYASIEVTADCACQVEPPQLPLAPGQAGRTQLVVSARRPWLGLGKMHRITATAVLSDQRLGTPEPTSQELELRVLPVVPVWMQLLAAILLLLLLLLLFRTPAQPGHTDFVNSVRFSGDALSALSGSDDRTIRRWTIEGDRLLSKGTLADTDQSVRVLRFVPRNNNEVAAGLENGLIQLLNVATGSKDRTLGYQSGDRVFALVFTANSRYLYSGHGSGLVLVWDFNALKAEPKRVLRLNRKLDYTVQTLALSSDERTLASAGRFNRLILWDLENPQARPRRLPPRGGANDLIWSADFANGRKDLLATGDSRGNITLWDLTHCRSGKPTAADLPIDVDCPQYSWPGHGKQAVRALAFSDDGRMLASGGDDGRVVLWPLTAGFKSDPQPETGQEILRHAAKVNSVDLTVDREGVLVISGSDDGQVLLRRLGGGDAN